MYNTDFEGISMAAENLRKDMEKVCGKIPETVSSPRNGGIISVVEKPLEGVSKALVIAGSDKRGTIYGIYELSRQIGVSPWYWWMDVPVTRNEDIYIKRGIFSDGEPKVAYRGIFINDE